MVEDEEDDDDYDADEGEDLRIKMMTMMVMMRRLTAMGVHACAHTCDTHEVPHRQNRPIICASIGGGDEHEHVHEHQHDHLREHR